MERNARRVTLALVLALSAWFAAAQVAVAAPTIIRAHFEGETRFDACGIGTALVSGDVVAVFNEAGNHFSMNYVITGTLVDTETGATYRMVDHTTQMLLSSQAALIAVQGGERTLVIAGSDGGLVTHAVVFLTIRPDGSISDFDIRFLECHPD